MFCLNEVARKNDGPTAGRPTLNRDIEKNLIIKRTLRWHIAALGIVAGYWCAQHWEFFEGRTLWPWLVAVVCAGILGAPIFALLGGLAMFAFFVDGSRPVVPLIKATEASGYRGIYSIEFYTEKNPPSDPVVAARKMMTMLAANIRA